MKLATLLVASTALCATSAFGVTPQSTVPSRASKLSPLTKPALVPTLTRSSGAAEKSALFRDPTATRGGAVPGWAAYNDALDKNPLTAKAFTSLVGWALGDLLAQVRYIILELLCLALPPYWTLITHTSIVCTLAALLAC